MRDYMLDKCPVSTYKDIAEVIEEDLGKKPEQLFASIEEIPIASASLAQVCQQHFHAKTILLNLSCLTFSNAALNYRMYNAALRCVDMMTSCMSCLNCQLHRAVLENS